MTVRSLFPDTTSGPAAATAFAANYIAGILAQVTQGGQWLAGYRWWVPPAGGLTAPQKCALWSYGFPAGSGTVVPGSVVTSAALVPGWNNILLPSPIPIAPFSTYIPCTGVNGAFPDTPGQFGAGDLLSGGIINGPLVAFSDTTGSNPEPYGLPQGIFSDFAGSDPSTQIPTVGNNSSNLWMDWLVSDQPPGYAGSFMLWPNKFDGAANVGGDAAVTFNLAVEVHLSVRCAADFLWFFSPPGAESLPTWAGVWPAAGTFGVTPPLLANTSPAWLVPDGSAAAVPGGGRCKCALAGFLPAGQYKASVFNANGAAGTWSPRSYGYWNGPAAAGIVNGPISAPGQAAATTAYLFNPTFPGATPPFTDGSQEPSQGTFSQALGYPYMAVDFNHSGPPGAIAENFFVDLEVTPAPLSGYPAYNHPWYGLAGR